MHYEAKLQVGVFWANIPSKKQYLWSKYRSKMKNNIFFEILTPKNPYFDVLQSKICLFGAKIFYILYFRVFINLVLSENQSRVPDSNSRPGTCRKGIRDHRGAGSDSLREPETFFF